MCRVGENVAELARHLKAQTGMRGSLRLRGFGGGGASSDVAGDTAPEWARRGEAALVDSAA